MPSPNLEILSQIPLEEPAPRPQQTTRGQPSPLSSEIYQRLMTVLQAVAMVLAVRVSLMVSLVGAFYLTMRAFDQGTSVLYIAVSYDVLVFIPMVMLAWKKSGRE
jgi:hypothetical protein